MALVTTVGSATANSYADAAFAVTFFTSIGLLSDWTTYNSGSDEAMLLRAMAVIESKDYMGSRANNDNIKQALEFPRTVTHYLGIDPVRLSGTTWTDKRGKEWLDDEIPTPIKQAQCWQAMAEAVNVYRQTNEAGEEEEFWAGSVRIRTNPTGSQLKVKSDGSSASVKLLLRPFLAREFGQTIRT